MSIEERLKEIILLPFNDSGNMTAMHDDKDKPPIIDEQIAQIKACFIGEGWVDATINNTDNPLYLTGEEWFTAFEREINKGLLDKSVSYLNEPGYLSTEAVKEAAKRASGLK